MAGRQIIDRRTWCFFIVVGLLWAAELARLAVGDELNEAQRPTIAANVQETIERAHSATVRIAVRRRAGASPATQYGSGVIVTYAGHIVTADHVVDGAARINVTSAEGKSWPAQLLLRDSTHDIALIKVSADTRLKPAVIASRATPPGETSVALIGHPYGRGQRLAPGVLGPLRLTTFNGRWSALRRVRGGVEPGDSGGGAFGARTGELVGMILALSSQTKGTAYVLPIEQVHSFLTRLTDPLELELIDAQELRNELGARARPVTFGHDGSEALLLATVDDHGKAAAAGWSTGDVLLTVGPYRMVNIDAVLYVMRQRVPQGEAFDCRLARRGEVIHGTFPVLGQ